MFTPVKSDGTPLGNLSARIQKAIGRVAVIADCTHSLGASRIFHGKKTNCGAIADFTDFSFHAVNVLEKLRKAENCNKSTELAA